MNVESMEGYLYYEEEAKKAKRRKHEKEAEMVEIVIEAASFSSLGTGMGLEKMAEGIGTVPTVPSVEIGSKIEMIKRTENCARVYEAALDKTTDVEKKMRKSGKKEHTKEQVIR